MLSSIKKKVSQYWPWVKQESDRLEITEKETNQNSCSPQKDITNTSVNSKPECDEIPVIEQDSEKNSTEELLPNSSEKRGKLDKNSDCDEDESSKTESIIKNMKLPRKETVRKEIKLPVADRGKLAFVLHNVYTKEECDAYIAKTEEMGYETALINIGNGMQIKDTSHRNSSRCIWDSKIEADILWDRIKAHIPERFAGNTAVGLNERLRFLRYDDGEFFKPHCDGSYERDNGERSFITVHLYFNEGFKGGSTTFLARIGKSDNTRVECVPKTGSVLIFQHNIYHEGSLLKKGRKYTVRTDVMYRPGN